MAKKLELLEKARDVRQNYGKSYLRQLIEICALRLGFSRLGADDYYLYRLYRDEVGSEGRAEYMGWRCQTAVDRILNDARWHFAHSDKIVTTMLLERLQVPFVPIRVVFDLQERIIPGIRFVRKREEVRDALKQAAMPMFVKPVDNALGRNTFRIESFDDAGDLIGLWGGRSMPFEEFFRVCVAEAAEGRGGMVFQDLVRPSRELAPLIGERLAGLRMIVLIERRPTLTHAILKIPNGNAITDNFRGGLSGTQLARVDLASGELQAVHELRDGAFARTNAHPDTGAAYDGARIPRWREYVEIVLRAATAFPGMRLQHWDVAVAEPGPVVLELNGDGCVQLPQVAYERGFYSGVIKDAVARSLGRMSSRGYLGTYAGQWYRRLLGVDAL